MEFSLILAEKIAMMLLWAVGGFIAVRAGALETSGTKTVSNVLVYILTPCMIVHAFQIELTREKLAGLAAAAVFSLVVQVVWILITAALRGPLRLSVIDRETMIYSNCGNLIMPLVSMALGDEYTFYVAAYVAVFNILIWTHGLYLMQDSKSMNPKKILLNPNLISILLGVTLMLAGIRLPSLVDGALAGFSDMVGPTSMLVIGMVIAEKNVLDAFRYPRTYPIIAGRLIVFPLIAILLLHLSGVLRRWQFLIPILMVSMLSAAAPPATLVSQLAVVCDRDSFQAGSYNIAGTLLCIITIPFILYIYQTVFPIA